MAIEIALMIVININTGITSSPKNLSHEWLK